MATTLKPGTVGLQSATETAADGIANRRANGIVSRSKQFGMGQLAADGRDFYQP
jgi:hypothetical protein